MSRACWSSRADDRTRSAGRQGIWGASKNCAAKESDRAALDPLLDEAERLCDRLLIIVHGRILATVRRASSSPGVAPLRPRSSRCRRPSPSSPPRRLPRRASAPSRSGAHLYFAAAPELLTPLMKLYEGRRMLLRPSNLEDVFLEIAGIGRGRESRARFYYSQLKGLPAPHIHGAFLQIRRPDPSPLACPRRPSGRAARGASARV